MAPRDQDKPPAALLRRTLAAQSDAADPCPDPEILAAYADRSLDADETARYELHFSNCVLCREQLAAMDRAHEPVGAAGGARMRTSPWLSLWDWRWLAPVAAVLALAAVFVARRPAAHPTIAQSSRQPLVAMNTPAAKPPMESEPQSVAPAPAASAPTITPPMLSANPPAKVEPSEVDALKQNTTGISAGKSEIERPATSEGALDKQPGRSVADLSSHGRNNDAEAKKAPANEGSTTQFGSGHGNGIGSQTVTVEAAAGDVSTPPPAPTAAPAVQKAARTQEMDGVTAVSGGAAETTSGEKTRTMPVATNLTAQNESVVLLEAGDETSAQTVVHTPDPHVLWRFPGGRFVERSIDAGATWHVQWTNENAQLVAGAAPSSDTCWIVGRGGIVLVTADGKKWKKVPPPAKEDFVSVAATDASSATVTATDSHKFTTTDGGKHWMPAP